MADERELDLETRLVHAGERRVDGAVTMPVFQSSTYLMPDDDEPDYDDIRYARLNNTPNHEALHEKLASLDGAEAGLVAASGMAAITTTLMTLLNPGDHVLVQRGIYGGTFSWIRDEFARQSIAYDLIDATDPAGWAEKLRCRTRVLYAETLSNPTLEVADLRAVVDFAREHELTSVVDNTFATPINCRPIERGIDLVVQSATKYLNGHSDLVAGAVTGSAELVERIRHRLNHFGGTLDPHAMFMLHRGLKTLSVRVRHQNDSALALANALEDHDAVARVDYPGLASHPQHALARDLLDGFGGMLSFALVDESAAMDVIRALKLALYAPSLGGPETLVVLPATSSHAGLSPDERRRLRISDGLVRVSVGLESPRDLIADFRHAANLAAPPHQGA